MDNQIMVENDKVDLDKCIKLSEDIIFNDVFKLKNILCDGGFGCETRVTIDKQFNMKIYLIFETKEKAVEAKLKYL